MQQTQRPSIPDWWNESGASLVHAIYVPGSMFHGHWLYLGDHWLKNPEHDPPMYDKAMTDYIMGLCGRARSEFDYAQQFFEWFYEQFPEGMTLERLEAQAKRGDA